MDPAQGGNNGEHVVGGGAEQEAGGLTPFATEKRMSPTASSFKKEWPKFKAWLLQNGAEIRVPSNEYELARFTTPEGVGVIYRDRSGAVSSLVGGANEAWSAWKTGSPWTVGSRAKRKNSKRDHRIKAILSRDGDRCFFCGTVLDGDITIEHLVAVAHGGPDHLSNLALSHERCSQRADHLSVAEKVRLRDELHAQPNNQLNAA